jgi:hypothetical protein
MSKLNWDFHATLPQDEGARVLGAGFTFIMCVYKLSLGFAKLAIRKREILHLIFSDKPMLQKLSSFTSFYKHYNKRSVRCNTL